MSDSEDSFEIWNAYRFTIIKKLMIMLRDVQKCLI